MSKIYQHPLFQTYSISHKKTIMLNKVHFFCIILFSTLFFKNQLCIAQESTVFHSSITSSQLAEAPVKLIPYPQNVTWGFQKSEIIKIQIKNRDQLSASIVKEASSIFSDNTILIKPSAVFYLEFREDTSLLKEAYTLKITNDAIQIGSNGEAGQFYALQTLRQLISKKNGKIVLHQCTISDAPKYPVRGYMLDVGRNYMSLKLLKEQLDIMAKYKLNVFQWHLTDRPAWRIESKKYPELNDAKNHRPTRNPGMFYTYEDIRELIVYAKDRQIQVIPEIDMPGHSDSFVTAMGCKMESEKGMLILEHVLEEFFDEIPKESCPTIHLGSDEVKVENPEEFMSKMISICNRNDRDVVVWNPGIKIKQDVIRQTWQGKHQENKNYREIDSWNNYVNNSEPMTAIPKLLFKPIGYKSENKIIGGVLCMWPDVKLKKEDDFINQNPIYPSLLTYAWSTWTADIKEASQDYLTMIPKKGTKEFEYFAEFEEYLLEHKKRYFNDKPFQYFKQSDKVWLLSKPFPKNDLLAIEKNLIEENENLKNYTKAYGNTIIIKDRFKQGGYYPKAKTGETVFAITHMHSDKAKTVKILIGFETPLRANRVYTGIPNKGHWDANGGEIWLNGKALQSPKWKQAGWKPSKQSGWGTKADQEIPWTKEELYWTRKPAVVHLKKGKNTIIIKVPSSTDYQNWMFTFIPLSMDGLEFSIE